MFSRHLILIAILPLMIAACEFHNENPVTYDDVPPLPPVGVRTISLDNAIELAWIDNQEPDLAGYNVYRSRTERGGYVRVGSATAPGFIDRSVVNGATFFYAITAFDFNGNESALSTHIVYDTPRREGLCVTLADRLSDAMHAGYDLSSMRTLHYDTDETDLYFERGNGIPLLRVWDDSDIQDMGFTRDLDEISSAPADGWLPSGTTEAVVGHTYVIWTFDNHFAKVRVTQIDAHAITFDWAYQTAPGNPELLVGRHGSMMKAREGRIRKASH